MSAKSTIRESQLRALVRVLLEDSSLGPFMVNVNPVVDPSAALTDPANKNSKPHNRVELKVALSDMVNGISDDHAEKVFDDIKQAIELSTEEEKDMKKDNVEEVIRRAVRKIIGEAAGAYTDTGMSYSGPMTGSASVPKGFASCEACEGEGYDEEGLDCKACRGRGYVKSSKRGYDTEGEKTFDDVAKELGYKNPNGARQFINTTLAKFKKNFELNRDDPDGMDILTLKGINDYIDYLNTSGELTPPDLELLKDHPAILWSLPDAQEHVAEYIRKNS